MGHLVIFIPVVVQVDAASKGRRNREAGSGKKQQAGGDVIWSDGSVFPSGTFGPLLPWFEQIYDFFLFVNLVQQEGKARDEQL